MFDHDFVYVLPAIANAAFDIQVIVSRCGLFFQIGTTFLAGFQVFLDVSETQKPALVNLSYPILSY